MVEYWCRVAGCERVFADGHELADHLAEDHDATAFYREVSRR